ncbi:unnamed protein product [Rotaria sp. Silwood2]|nr:unnamed protein product [Rotaria sp. Silwood2]CAF4365489.1 unnamed protein product [Rotaria sp. Silwood2]CAF4695246.1 unnamed protein product [Rotaria sp. Silwood2]
MTHELGCRLWNSFRQINIFENGSDDRDTIEHQKLSTSIYIISIFILLVIVGIFALFIVHSTNENVRLLSLKQFETIFEHYSSTITCPCSKLAIPYGAFTSVKIQFHQVCLSLFTSQTWIDSIYVDRKFSSVKLENNFLSTLSAFWQIIAGFCELSNTTINNGIAQFNVTTLLSPMAVNQNMVRIQSRVALTTIISTVRSTLIRNLLAIERITGGNQLVSGLAKNFYAHFTSAELQSNSILSARAYANCSCLNTNGCPHPATFYYSAKESSIPIPGMQSDCLIVDAVLNSSLECYYDRTCVNRLHPAVVNIEPLKMNINVNFKPNSTIQQLLDNLMVDEIFVDIAFDKYFTQCNPHHCSYVRSRRFDISFATNIIIGVYSGLSIILNLIVPLIAKYLIRWRQRNNQTEILNNMPRSNQGKMLFTHKH